MFLVDRHLPGLTRDQFQAAQRAVADVAGSAAAAGVSVRYLRGIFVPSQGRAVCLFEAPDANSVRDVNLAAGVPLSSVVEALDLAGPAPPSC